MARHAGVLPVEVSSFVDRRRERSELKRLLTTCRLVTVTGVGGVGKTRIALRVVAEVRRSVPDGVWWVELSALRDAELVPYAVAEVLGVQDDATPRPMEQVLADHLARRELLLVLDTCEHLIGACARLVERLLRAAPGLRVLATSRQALGAAEERVYPMSSLTVEPLREWSGVSDGVELFVERAQAAHRGFALTEDNREAVTRLCGRLEGIPLAIELAAVRVRALSVHEILDRLDDRFALLAGRARGGVAHRHETLQAAIDWSFELCSPAERVLWARVSVFAGSFDLAAVAEVCADDRLPAGELPAVVAGLVDKSVLLRDEHHDGVRCRLLDTIRDYGQERLEQTGERAVLLRRHRDYYLRMGKRFEADWCGPRQPAWRARLTSEHANLRAALDFCLGDRAEHQVGLELASALWFYWIACGFVREGRHYLDRALALNPEPSPARTTGLCVRVWLAVAQSDFAAASALLDQCRSQAQQQGEPITAAAEGWFAYLAGIVEMLSGNQPRAVVLGQRSSDLHRHGGDLGMGLICALTLQAMSLALAAEFDRAVAVAEQCRALCDQHGEQWMRSYADYIHSLAALGRGEHATAVAHARDAVRVKRVLGDRIGLAMTLDQLAVATATRRQAERAARLLGIAHQVWQTFGLPQLGSPDLLAARRGCERLARTALGDTAYQAAFDAGRALDPEAALAYAVDESPPQPRPEPSPDATGWAPLTRRERQVAELVGDGQTNREIAARLGIAKRTVDAHVEHILAKLGLDSRTQITARTTGRDPADPRADH
ncbi:non-specific serine/threonine protein kinase [Allokutzneria albata]|uniref:Non-specific serine/threonine protein kinase n=1 Tax=Allokutzneria albata TaxID=211114 RepID=A0A1H0CHQ0_ALLAB|nr:non-specific serine/threonine protein kinase [Allokutzneria albata]